MKILIALCLFTLSSFAGPLDKFHQRFEIIKDDAGKLQYIKAKGITSSFNINLYLKNFVEDLHALSKEIYPEGVNSISEAESEEKIDSILNEIGLKSNKYGPYKSSYGFIDADRIDHNPFKKDLEKIRKSLKDSFKGLKVVSVKDAVSRLDREGVIENFIEKINEFYQNLDLSVISQPNKPKFFYNKKIANLVFKQAMQFAQKKLKDIPYLDLAAFIFRETEKRIIEQRIISQNIFLYYVSNYEKEIGLSAEEVDKVVSSIYESRIAVNGWLESQKAKTMWRDYGWSKFDTTLRTAKSKYRNYKRANSELEHVDYIFYNGFTAKGAKVIYNFSVNEHQYSQKPSIAFYYDYPARVRSIRTAVKLGQFALGFVPKLPGFIKSQVHNFANSYYVNQSLSDAYLYAFFEAGEFEAEKSKIKDQISNPYIKL